MHKSCQKCNKKQSKNNNSNMEYLPPCFSHSYVTSSEVGDRSPSTKVTDSFCQQISNPKSSGKSLGGTASINGIQIFASNFIRLILFRKTRSPGNIILASILAQEILFLSVSGLYVPLKVSILTLIGFSKDEIFFPSLGNQSNVVIRTADTECLIIGLSVVKT